MFSYAFKLYRIIQATSVTILPFCRVVKVLQTCTMAAAYTIAWIIGVVACFFPLQQIIGLLLPTTANHCLPSYADDITAVASRGQRCVCVWLQQRDCELCHFRTSCGRGRVLECHAWPASPKLKGLISPQSQGTLNFIFRDPTNMG